MKIPRADHLARPWRVHTLAPDFELLDVWGLLLAPDTMLADLLPQLWDAASRVARSPLGRARVWLGQRLGWDAHELTLPIPGCAETTVAARLAPGERGSGQAPSPLAEVTVRTVYRQDREVLYEVSNTTIHALFHVGLIDRPATLPASRATGSGDAGAAGRAATLAVYIKSRGVLSRLYMLAILPLRQFVIYPALLAQVEAACRAHSQADRAA
jgi:hypothetical protein